MQTTQQTTNTPVHIKVSHENEFRRFLLNPVTFSQLETTLKTLFNLESEFRIKFQDDENDWVLLTTDQELVYATELSGSPLRLQVKLLENAVPTEASPCQTERGRGRCGRGGRGRGAGRGGCKLSPEERLSMKSTRITDRINQLESKLSSKQLTSERERVIRWRLAKLQEKLEFVKATQTSLETCYPQTTEPTPTESQEATAPETKLDEETSQNENPWARRGGRGRGGRGCRGGQGCDKAKWKGLKSRMDPELLANWQKCRQDLIEAKQSGDAEKIAACKAAFWSAKIAKKEAMQALKAEAAAAETNDQKA